MDKVIRSIKLISFVIIGLLLVYWLARTFSVLTQEYSVAEMDWNQDGKTTVSEFFDASDIGKRDSTQTGVKCVEYFSYKDGLPVKVVFPQG